MHSGSLQDALLNVFPQERWQEISLSNYLKSESLLKHSLLQFFEKDLVKSNFQQK